MCRFQVFGMERVQRVLWKRPQIENAKVLERDCRQAGRMRQTIGVERDVPVVCAHLPVTIFLFNLNFFQEGLARNTLTDFVSLCVRVFLKKRRN